MSQRETLEVEERDEDINRFLRKVQEAVKLGQKVSDQEILELITSFYKNMSRSEQDEFDDGFSQTISTFHSEKQDSHSFYIKRHRPQQ